MIRRPPSSTPFPYPTLFRSRLRRRPVGRAGGLVEQQHVRLDRERARHRHPLHLAVRQLVPPATEQRGDPEPRGGIPYSAVQDRKSTRLNSSHLVISYAGFSL